MTFNIFDTNFLTINYRTGVGVDIEFPSSRPVWLVHDDTPDKYEMGYFEGVVLLLPLIIVTFGKVYDDS